MKIDYDPQKDEVNIKKHNGVSLAQANEIEWDTLYAVQDNRFDYGVVRMIGYALIGDRVFCVVYTDRGAVRRIISLRKANKREVTKYARNI